MTTIVVVIQLRIDTKTSMSHKKLMTQEGFHKIFPII